MTAEEIEQIVLQLSNVEEILVALSEELGEDFESVEEARSFIDANDIDDPNIIGSLMTAEDMQLNEQQVVGLAESYEAGEWDDLGFVLETTAMMAIPLPVKFRLLTKLEKIPGIGAGIRATRNALTRSNPVANPQAASAFASLGDDIAKNTIPQLKAAATQAGITIPPGTNKAGIVQLLDDAILASGRVVDDAAGAAAAGAAGAGAATAATAATAASSQSFLRRSLAAFRPTAVITGGTSFPGFRSERWLPMGTRAFVIGSQAAPYAIDGAEGTIDRIRGRSGEDTDDGQEETDAATQGEENAAKLAAEQTSRYFVSSRTFPEAAMVFANWFTESGRTSIQDDTGAIDFEGMGMNVHSLNTPEFREQWDSHWKLNWQTDPHYSGRIIDKIIEQVSLANPEYVAQIMETTGLSADIRPREFAEALIDDPLRFGMATDFIDKGIEEFTDDIIDEGGHRVVSRTDDQGNAEYLLSSVAGGDPSITAYVGAGDIFDLTSNGVVNGFNTTHQLNELGKRDPKLLDLLSRQLEALGYYDKAGIEYNPGLSVNQISAVYKLLHNDILEMHLDELSTGGDILKAGEVKQRLVESQMNFYTAGERLGTQQTQLANDIRQRVKEEMFNRGWQDNSGGQFDFLVDQAIKNAVSGSHGSGQMGTERDRALAGNVIDQFWGGQNPEFGPHNSMSAALVQASKNHQLNPEVRNAMDVGSLSRSFRGLTAPEARETAINRFVSLMNPEQALSAQSTMEAFRRYAIADGSSRATEYTDSDMWDIVNAAWAQDQNTNEQQQQLVDTAVGSLMEGREDLGNPNVSQALSLINQGLDTSTAVLDRSR